MSNHDPQSTEWLREPTEETVDETQQHEHDDASTGVQSAGDMIRQAREALGLSVADLAAHTRLAKHILNALEKDNIGDLIEPVYVRGYFRKVSRVLKLDEAALIAAYEAQSKPLVPKPPAKLRLASGSELGSSYRLPVVMAILLAIIAVVVSAFLWLSRSKEPAYAVPTSVTAVPATVGTPSAGTAATESDAMSAAPSAEVSPQQAAAEAQPTDSQPDTAATQPMSVPASGLHLRFRQDSWVRVDDANGKTVVSELRKAGTQADLSGTPPLNVFLGNAPGVDVTYDGQTVDTAAFTRSNKTARFRLPQE